jgi:penicillin-binding protein 2
MTRTFNPHYTIQIFKKRLLIIVIFMLVCLLGLIARLIQLQLKDHAYFTTLSANNRLRIEPLNPKRGLIYDRYHRCIADNIPTYTLEFRTSSTQNPQKVIQTLSQLLNISPTLSAHWQKRIRQAHAFVPITLHSQLTEKERARIYVNLFQLPGVSIHQQSLRHYPYDAITATPLGLIRHDPIQPHIYPVNQKHQLPDPSHGLSGVERHYNTLLTGKSGYREIEVNANGHQLRTVSTQPATPGQNLILTLDMVLQKAAVKAFGKSSGAAVVIAPHTGEILAMVSQPNYQPNVFLTTHASNQLKKWQNDPDHPLFNRATFGLFPPASTVKPLLGLMALQTHTVDLQTTIQDPGYFQLPHTQHRYRDWLPGGHGQVNLHKAIAVSCDTYFYQLSIKLGIKKINTILSSFGLGQAVSSDLSEHAGVLNSPDWKHTHQHEPWYTGDTIISAIGQGNTLVTPLQLAHAAALIGQHGHGFKPHIVKAVIDPLGKTLPQPLIPWKTLSIDPTHYSQIIQAMQAVIQSPYQYHTGWRFGKISYTIAGKTGTAELYHRQTEAHHFVPKKLRDHSWFIGFAPVDHPRIAVAVIVEHDSIATGVARDIFEAYFKTASHQDAST